MHLNDSSARSKGGKIQSHSSKQQQQYIMIADSFVEIDADLGTLNAKNMQLLLPLSHSRNAGKSSNNDSLEENEHWNELLSSNPFGNISPEPVFDKADTV